MGIIRVRIVDIARMSGVSKSTVSRVLNNKSDGVGGDTRRRVQKLIDKLQHRPNLLARGIATSRTKTIGLIIPDITNPFFTYLIKSMESSANLNGYTVLISCRVLM